MQKIFFTLLVIAMASVASPVFALTVSPVKVEVTGDPGVTLHGEIELFNEQEGDRTFFTSFENFEPSGDSGAPRFIGAKSGLATWLQASTSVVSKSGTRILVPYTITIPQNAEPGGYFAAIFFGSQAPGAEGSGQVSVGGKIGVLILLRVSGAVPEGGGLLNFSTQNNQRFFSTLPVAFTYRFNNIGGDRVVPAGEIKIKNTLQFNAATLPANENEGSVLPSSDRKFEVTWGQAAQVIGGVSEEPKTGFFEMVAQEWKEFHFGWYTANLNISWGVTNQTSNASWSFYVIPWHLLLIVFVLLAIIGFVGKIGLTRYNRWVVAQATHHTATHHKTSKQK